MQPILYFVRLLFLLQKRQDFTSLKSRRIVEDNLGLLLYANEQWILSILSLALWVGSGILVARASFFQY